MSLIPHTTTIRTVDGLQLFVRRWRPAAAVRGVVCVVHGHGEHGERHAYLAETLAEQAFAVVAPDLRGHGRSEGKRGHAPSYERLLDDVDAALQHAREEFPEAPVFLYGHSMGGNIVLNHALRRPESGIAGVIATGPWLRLTHEISRRRVIGASLMERLWPSMTVSTSWDLPKLDLGPEAESPSPGDPLSHDRISMRLYLGVRRAGQWALRHAGDLRIPALLLHGEWDDITDPAASLEFARRSGSMGEARILDGDYHNVHRGHQPDEYVGQVLEWLQARTPSPD